jgi:dihydroxyacetone kinase-like predicted kinase
MREQNRELAQEMKKHEKENAFIAVSTGEGIDSVFTELGAGSLIQGGQSMNPSADDIVKAIRRANARTVFVLPNNSNIILAAQQAAEISDRNVVVIPSKSVMQGINAAMAFASDATVEINREAMQAAIDNVVSGAVTYSVRDTSYNGTHIEKDDIIGLMNNKIVAVADSVEEASKKLLRIMIAEKPEDTIVTIFYGEDVKKEDADALLHAMQEEYPNAEFMAQYGGQPLYYYYFSVE